MRFIFLLSIWCMIGTIHGLCREGCFFNDKSYEPNSRVQFGCFAFQCSRSNTKPLIDSWKFLYINASCAKCIINDDPHFVTFDHQHYDFHGFCNYTISQPVKCCDLVSSYFPSYGVFGDFQPCVSGLPGSKCLDLTTYKISDDLSIQIKHTASTPSLEINGNPLSVTSSPVTYSDCSPSSVIVWESNDRVIIVGAHYSIVVGYRHMIIYTIPEHKNKIAGLCGFYSGTTKDEYQLRDCSYQSDDGIKVSFGANWKTIDQRDKGCKTCFWFSGSLSQVIEEPAPCDTKKANETCKSAMERAIRQCPYGYSDQDISWVIEDCIEDCCSTGIENCEKWANVGQELVCMLNYLERVTGGGPYQLG